MDPVAVDIWSDVACPWCWLGQAHLQVASKEAQVPVKVRFHAFQLSPQQKEAEPVREYLERKYGDANVRASQDRLVEMGRRVGLDFDFERSLATNTFDAHRLHQLAVQRGCGPELMRRLFEAQHAQGADVADPDVLQQVGVAAGLPAADIKEILDSDAFAEAVQEDLAAATRLGVRGVPFFVLEQRIGLSGAQPVEVFVEALREASKK